VAAGHIRAAEKGRLANVISWKPRRQLDHAETLAVLEEITGVPRRKEKFLSVCIGHSARERNDFFFHGPAARAPLAGVRMARNKMWFNPAKADSRAPVAATPPRQALADAVEWFGRMGM